MTHVFFSRRHDDHCVDFVRLFLNRWDMGASHVNPRISRHRVRERVIAEMVEIYEGTGIWGEDPRETAIRED